LVSGPQLGKSAKNIDFLGMRQQQKTKEIHPKLGKIVDSRFEFGPQVGHPCFNGMSIS
jgi:hypothetical protein